MPDLQGLLQAVYDETNHALRFTSSAYVPLAGGTSTGEQVAPDFKATGKTGATAQATILAGGTASGAPTTGAHVVGELVLDATGAAWYCTVAGTPGTWAQVGSAASPFATPGTAYGAAPNALTGSPTLAAWYKANTLAGSDGDAIATWPDSSGNSRDLTQATGSKQPLLKKLLPYLGGGTALLFDGVDDFVANVATGLVAGTAWTWGAVFFAQGTGNAGVMRGGGTGVLDMFRESNLWKTKAASSVENNAGYSMPNGAFVMTATYDGAEQVLYIDGRPIARTATTGNNSVGDLTVGAINSGSYFFPGYIAELFIYQAVLTLAQRLQLVRYCANKYSLPVVIPA